MATIKLRNIRKTYGKLEVLKDVNLDIEDGEFVVFVGPSGCGKSTLLRVIAGLGEQTSGDVVIDGKTVNDVDPAARGIAMVFQSYALYPHMSVKDNIGFGLKIAGRPRNEIDALVREAAADLQIDHLLTRMPRELSGGQRQRVAIGRAIVRDPKVFLFDEPLSNLDAELRIEMRQQIARLHNRLAASMIYVTHDQIEAMTLADKIVVLRSGQVEQVGAPLELYEQPLNEFVAGFIGSPKMNFIDVSLSAAETHLATLRLPDGSDLPFRGSIGNVALGSTLRLGIRPESVSLASEGLPFVSDLVERIGTSTFLYGTFCGVRDFRVHLPHDTLVKPGETFNVGVDLDAFHLFGADGKRLNGRVRQQGARA